MTATFDPIEFSYMRLPERFPPEDSIKYIKFGGDKNVIDGLDLSLTPYLKMPLHCKGNPLIQWIYLVAPTQSGKTAFLLGVVADCILQDPGTMKYCLPDEKTAKHVMQDRLIPMLTNSPELKSHIKAASRERIDCDNMSILTAWSNSPATVSGTPCKFVIADEIRLFRKEIRGEANALKQLHDRMTSYRAFGQAQGFGASSAGIYGDLLWQVTQPTSTTNVLYWHLKCKHCGLYFKPDFFRDLKDYDTLKCHFCKGDLDDRDMKRELNKDACYGTIDFEGKREPVPFGELVNTNMAFKYCSISSPFRPFKEIKQEYLETKDKPFQYKNFIMCWLAQEWEEDLSKSDPDVLQKISDHSTYTKYTVPEDALFLVSGIDVQGYGYNVCVSAWTPRGVFIIDWFIIKCNYKSAKISEIQRLIGTQVVDRIYKDKWGKCWKTALFGIDCNSYRTMETREAMGIFTNVVKTANCDRKQTVSLRYNAKLDLYFFDNDYYQGEVESLLITPETLYLPMNTEKNFLAQMTNCRKIAQTHKVTGEVKYYWTKKGQTDYRSAFLESLVCLDIHFENDSSLRTFLNDPDFCYNPYDYEYSKITRQDNRYMNHEDFNETRNDNNNIKATYY